MELYRLVRQAESSYPQGIYRLMNFGQFHSGTVRNALSAYARMEGSLRAFQPEVFDGLKEQLFEAVKQVEEKFGCTVQVTLGDSYPAVMNDPDLMKRVQAVAPVKMLADPTMTSEDFSWYQRYVPGMFFFLGLGDTPALHADTFDFDESLLIKGADLFEKLAEDFV